MLKERKKQESRLCDVSSFSDDEGSCCVFSLLLHDPTVKKKKIEVLFDVRALHSFKPNPTTRQVQKLGSSLPSPFTSRSSFSPHRCRKTFTENDVECCTPKLKVKVEERKTENGRVKSGSGKSKVGASSSKRKKIQWSVERGDSV